MQKQKTKIIHIIREKKSNKQKEKKIVLFDLIYVNIIGSICNPIPLTSNYLKLSKQS